MRVGGSMDTITQLDTIRYQIKTSVIGKGYLFLRCWPIGSHNYPVPSCQIQATVNNICYLQNLTVRYTALVKRTRKTLASAGLEDSSLLASVHRAGICHSHNQRQKVIGILTQQLWILNPACCTRDFSATNPHWYDSGTNTIGVTSHFLIGSKAHYKRWNPYIPDTANEAKSLWLNSKSLLSPRRKPITITATWIEQYNYS